MKTLEALYKIGPFISGASILIGAGAAWLTAIKYTKRTTELSSRAAEMSWLDSFRQLYGDFWDEGDMAIVRSWIASDVLYEKELKPILKKRLHDLDSNTNSLEADQYVFIEKLDKFCSVLIRMEHVEAIGMTEHQKILWQSVLGEFWIRRMNDRPDLAIYVSKFWPIKGITQTKKTAA